MLQRQREDNLNRKCFEASISTMNEYGKKKYATLHLMRKKILDNKGKCERDDCNKRLVSVKKYNYGEKR